MHVIKNCWSEIDTYNCQYGAHVFSDSIARIYVNNWLAPSRKLFDLFEKKNNEGFVGHCILVFKGVREFDFNVSLYEYNDIHTIESRGSMNFSYIGDGDGGLNEYNFEGSLNGFNSSVLIHIKAEFFELHILGRNEPARE